MGLDFSFFREEAQPTQTRTESGQNSTADTKAIQTHVENLNAVESPLAPLNQTPPKQPQERAPALKVQQQLNTHYEDEAQRVYKTYQENIRKAGGLRSELLKGAQAGESCYSLLLKACKCISFMTSDTVLASTMESIITSVYGHGLLEPQPLEIELAQLRTRLDTLKASEQREQTPEARERIADSIKAHEKKAAELERLIDRQG